MNVYTKFINNLTIKHNIAVFSHDHCIFSKLSNVKQCKTAAAAKTMVNEKESYRNNYLFTI